MSRIIIHDYRYDESIEFLKKLYDSLVVYDSDRSNSEIRNLLKNNSEIWMLGHGTPYGLLTRRNYKKGGEEYRLLINSQHVNFLRNKICVGIWCYANQFAEKYKLSGLFSGMVISEQMECDWILGYTPTKEDVERCNYQFVKALRECLNCYPLSEIPEIMREICPDNNPINKYNFNSIYYYV